MKRFLPPPGEEWARRLRRYDPWWSHYPWRKAALGILVVALAGGNGLAADLEALLPPGDSIAPWTKADAPVRYEADDLFMFIDGGAELYLQYGFVRVISQEYARGEDSIVCTIYEMKDPEAAYGIFSYTRDPKKASVDLGDGSFKGSLLLAFWQDRYYVNVERFVPGDKLEGDVMAFARRISERIGRHSPPPALLSRLPSKGLIPGSEKLLKGPLTVNNLLMLPAADPFQLAAEDRVLYGRYRLAGGEAKLFLAVYKEKGKAERVASSLQGLFSPDRGFRPAGQPEGASAWVKDGRYDLLRKGADHLVLVTEAPSLKEAANLARP